MKTLNIWKLLISLLYNSRVKEKITRGIGKYFELNNSVSTTYQNLLDTTKLGLKGNLQL